MADRNTKINGNQIKDATVTADELASSVAGDGISGGAGTALALDLNELTAVVVDVSADLIAIEDATDSSTKKESIADLVSAIAGTGLTATAGVLSADGVTDNIIESDFVKTVLAPAVGAETALTSMSGGSAVLANSVKVFLNGLLQEEGAGNDYTIVLSTGTITFLTALEAGDIVHQYGVLDN